MKREETKGWGKNWNLIHQLPHPWAQKDLAGCSRLNLTYTNIARLILSSTVSETIHIPIIGQRRRSWGLLIFRMNQPNYSAIVPSGDAQKCHWRRLKKKSYRTANHLTTSTEELSGQTTRMGSCLVDSPPPLIGKMRRSRNIVQRG